MTTTLILSGSGDGYLAAANASYNNAVDGAGAILVAGGTELAYGIGPGYVAYEAFISFAYTRPTNEVEVAVSIGARHSQHSTPGIGRSLLWYYHNWGTLAAADWASPNVVLNTLTGAAEINSAHASGTSQYVWGGSNALIDVVRETGSATYGFVGVSSNQLRYGLDPTVDEWSAVWSAETSYDPTMVVTTAPRSTLFEVLGAQVQLSDGTWCVLEHDGTATDPTILLRHVTTAGTASTKATIPIGITTSDFAVGYPDNSWTTGAQALALAVDSSDNLYVIGRGQGGITNIACKAYAKGVGYTWTAATLLLEALPASETDSNNFAATWHDTGGAGTVVAMVSRATGEGERGVTNEMVWVSMSAVSALAGSGTLIRHAGSVLSFFVPSVPTTAWATQTNDSGTGLDIAALSATKGVVHTWTRRGRLGALQPTCKARYTINPTTGVPSSQFYEIPETSAGTWGVKTASGKLRVIPIDADTCAVVSADSDTGWGLTVAVIRNSGTSTTWTLLGRVRLGNESLTTMPSPATLAESAAWDATFFTGPQKLWVYYFDTANGQRLMRTAVSLQSYTATREEIEVNASVGASGSTNLAIRVARSSASDRRNLITVANRTSGGTLSTIYIVDTPNEAPTGPTLTTRSNFDGSLNTAFSWTFTDPDPGDTQSGFQLDINSASGVDYYDTGRLGAAITYVGASAVAVGSNTSVAPSLPPSVSAGDLLVVQASIRNSGTGTVNTPTGWGKLAESGNMAILGRIAKSGAASAENSPTVSFTGGVANATTMARAYAWRGTDQNIATVVAASAAQLNGSAANIAYPQLVPGASGCAVAAFGWKQDDWTSVAQLSGMTEIADDPTVTGDDAGQVADYVIQSASATISSGSFTVTGGVSAISRAIMLALRPYQAPTASSFTLPASTLTQPGSWQWRVKTWDAAGAEGAWSNYGTFSTGVGGTVTVTDPVADNPANIITSTYTVGWSLVGATQSDFRVVVKRTDTEAETYNSGWTTSASTTHGITGMVSDVEHRIEVTTRTAGLVESNTGTRLITPSYATPDQPAITVTEEPDAGHTVVAVTNPVATGDHPDVDYNQIQRRATTGDDADEDWVVVGAVAPNGQWQDYTAASMATYEYRVAAVAVDGNIEYSDVEEGTLALQGVWIHDPIDPANVTATHYLYGGGGKSDGVEVNTEGFHYAGRALPVYEFGEQESEQVDIPIQVPFGEDWAGEVAALLALARARTVLCVRDARGRRVFGVIASVARSDRPWGTEVGFTIARSDYDQAYTGTP